MKKLPLFVVSMILLAFEPANEGSNDFRHRFRLYLGCMESADLKLSKKSFDSLIALPFCAKDTSMQSYPIQSFRILYAERGLFQDSAGLPIIVTDYTEIPVEGSSLERVWVEQFQQRSYKGDTVIIQQVKVLGPENKSHACKGMKIVITE